MPVNEDADDVSDLQFGFTDAAFTNSDAAEVTNATGPASSSLGIDFEDNPIFLTYSTSIDISTAVFSTTFLVSFQETDTQGLAFNTDGTKMYIVGRSGHAVYEYALSTPFDLNSASFSGNSFSVTEPTFEPQDLAFNTDGTKMYILFREEFTFANGTVNEYGLSTAFDITSASFITGFNVAAQVGNPTGLAFNNDGTRMYVVDFSIGRAVREYGLSAAFDISSASFTTRFSTVGRTNQPRKLAFNRNGTKMFVMGADNGGGEYSRESV